MPASYLHKHEQFPELIRIVAEQRGYRSRQIFERIKEWIDRL